MMDLRRYTFVTVGFPGEFGLLSLQARSMRLYCPPDLIEEIIIIDNSLAAVLDGWQEKVLHQYGELAKLVRFVPGVQLIPILTDTQGWWTQQVLKIRVAGIVRSD